MLNENKILHYWENSQAIIGYYSGVEWLWLQLTTSYPQRKMSKNNKLSHKGEK